jgi:hypothetical protein
MPLFKNLGDQKLKVMQTTANAMNTLADDQAADANPFVDHDAAPAAPAVVLKIEDLVQYKVDDFSDSPSMTLQLRMLLTNHLFMDDDMPSNIEHHLDDARRMIDLDPFLSTFGPLQQGGCLSAFGVIKTTRQSLAHFIKSARCLVTRI